MSTVLLVDDEPDIRIVLSAALAAAGHRVLEAGDGSAALETIRAGGVDVVLLDLMLPVMDGWAVLWTLHDMASHPPVIVISALTPQPDHDPPLGAVSYLQKPFRPDDLVRTIQETLAPH